MILLAEVDVTSLVVNHVVAAVLDIVVMVVLEQWHYSKNMFIKITQTLGSLEWQKHHVYCHKGLPISLQVLLSRGEKL